MTNKETEQTDSILKERFQRLRADEQRAAPDFPSEADLLSAKIKSASNADAPRPQLKPALSLPIAASLAAIALVIYLQQPQEAPTGLFEDDAYATYIEIMDSQLVTTDEFLTVSDAVMPAMSDLPRFQLIQPSPVFDI